MWNHVKRASVFVKNAHKWKQVRRQYTNNKTMSDSTTTTPPNPKYTKLNPSFVIGLSAYLTSLCILLCAENVQYMSNKTTKLEYRLKKLTARKNSEKDEVAKQEIAREIQDINANPYFQDNCRGLNYLSFLPQALRNSNDYLFAFPIVPAAIAGLTARRLFNSQILFRQLFQNNSRKKGTITYQAMKKSAIMTFATTSSSVFATVVMIQAIDYWENRKVDKSKELVEADADLVRKIGGIMATAVFLFIPGMIFVTPTYIISYPVAFVTCRRLLRKFYVKNTSSMFKAVRA